MDRWAWDQVDPWLEIRCELPIGAMQSPPITTMAKGPTLSITATLAAAPVPTTDRFIAYARFACASLATLFLLMYLASVIIRR